jgi:hypothetical protein
VEEIRAKPARSRLGRRTRGAHASARARRAGSLVGGPSFHVADRV